MFTVVKFTHHFEMMKKKIILSVVYSKLQSILCQFKPLLPAVVEKGLRDAGGSVQDEMLLQWMQLQGEDTFIEGRLMMAKPSEWLHALI